MLLSEWKKHFSNRSTAEFLKIDIVPSSIPSKIHINPSKTMEQK